MPSNRRLRVMLFIALSLVIVVLWYTADTRQARTNDFRSKTLHAMEAKDSEQAEMAKKMASRLKEAERVVDAELPDAAEHVLVPGPPNAIDSATDAKKQMLGVAQDGKDNSKQPRPKEQSQEEHDIEQELNSILKRSPIIIFSKTYCPHSKRAKRILLDRYKIVPAPYVAELDTHPLGRGLQDALEKTTGRRTVPNVLINGKSIGGGDDVAQLDSDGELVSKIKNMGGKRIIEAKLA